MHTCIYIYGQAFRRDAQFDMTTDIESFDDYDDFQTLPAFANPNNTDLLSEGVKVNDTPVGTSKSKSRDFGQFEKD